MPKKLSELTGAVPSGTDHVMFLDDPDGTPATRISDVSNFLAHTPYQWLIGSRIQGATREQVIPSGVWVPIHFGQAQVDATIGRATEAATGQNVTNNEQLTTGGGQTIEVADASSLRVPAGDQVAFLVIEDTTDNVSQVVQYTGISLGTGSGGNDQITGVSLGNFTLTSGTRFNVRQAIPEFIDPTDRDAALADGFGGNWYLAQSTATIAWEADPTETGVRRCRMLTYSGFGATTIPFPVYYATDVYGTNTEDGLQHQVCSGQPGMGTTATEWATHVLQVYQNSGGDLKLKYGGLPAYPIVMNAWFPALEA